ncbi:MAG: DUF6455 family protein [Pseudooceanicola sp.]
MKSLGDVQRHLFLVKRMARATGVDLAGALQQGRVTEADWAETVTRCRACTCADRCDAWLAEGELNRTANETAPGYCENRALFSGLGLQAAE